MRSRNSLNGSRATTVPFPQAEKRAFRINLLRWFAANRRTLPWRSSRDPYHIWLSEIMLQQTRVAAVLDHYRNFLRRFPDLKTLAAARPQQVLAAWSGLGYYRRARALQQAARIVVRDHGGCLPSTAESLRDLPGIGRYTAAAVASIAFQRPCAVVDGNVERVLRRVLGWRNQSLGRIWDAAQELLSPRSPGDFNQAMMELGATLCLPALPRCQVCPIRRLCRTRGPLPIPTMPPRKSAEITYALAVRDQHVYLVRRAARQPLMPGMWELPSIAANGFVPDFTLRHSITVTDYTVHIRRVQSAPPPGGRWFSFAQAAALPLTGLARKVLRRASLV